MDIVIDRASRVPLYRQIVERISEMIHSAALPAGFRLPPERRLAEALGVNRSTVLNAYRQLKGLGLVDAHVGRGTIVGATAPRPAGSAGGRSLPWRQLLREGAARSGDPLIRDLLALTERQDMISLAAGLPSRDLMPAAQLRETLDQVIDAAGGDAFAYCPTEGHTPLRETLSQWIASRGICCDPAEVLILSGSQQGLDLAARLFVDPGDTVIVEEPTYIGALDVFRTARARLVGIPTDHDGMCVDQLAEALERHRPKLIYTLPTFQNPSGGVLALERRHRLLELARAHQVPVLEDDPYAELRYEGTPLPSLKALDSSGHVLYLSTFSKVLVPGLRLGYLIAPREAVRHFALARQTVDLHANSLGQWLVERFIREGLYERHLSFLRTAYAQRRDVMGQALSQAEVDGLRWKTPAGGFYFWCRLPEGVERSLLNARAVESGVAYLPGEACYIEDASQPFVRLAFSYPSQDRIRAGVERFAEAVRHASGAVRAGTTPTVGTPTIV